MENDAPFVPENKRNEARAFWERTHNTAVAQGLNDVKTNDFVNHNAKAVLVAETAMAIADKALRHWMERW